MRLILIIGIFLSMSACSGGGSAGSGGSIGSLNPFNWFGAGGGQQQGAALSLAPRRGYPAVVDTRPLVDQITALTVEKTATGVIVTATALTPSQGYHSAGLFIVASDRSDEITVLFRARPPVQVTRIGPSHLREITAGLALSAAQIRGVRRVIVVAERNSRTVRP
ncbi:MAG: hypothetical protein ACU0C9_12855 [Paracoccaceae bacterium]